MSRIHLAPFAVGCWRRAWVRSFCGDPISHERRWQLFRPPLALDPVCGRCLRLLGFRHDRERKRGASPAPIRYILDWRDAK